MKMLAIALLVLPALTLAQPADIVLADFEGPDYGAWKAEGEAFGNGPARGTLERQMPVEGFAGKGLVNSFRGQDKTTGTLTSPEFKIERAYVTFLIGGGGFEGKTCMNLIVEGKVARTATGPNVEPGGSERLEAGNWDVKEFAGKTALIVIVDNATGGWGHINVDQIVLTDTKPAAAVREREVVLEKKYLHLPVKTGAKKERVAVVVEGVVVREFEIELSDKPDWFAHVDVGAWRGKTATIRAAKIAAGNEALAKIAQADEIGSAETVYREALRPQLRFSAKRGWLNDPNGMVYADGEYHLYFQHNPYGYEWGNMHWGHAVSKDLVHWEELPIAIYPKKFGDWAFSGSAVVDKENTSGWKKGENELLVGAYTSTGRGECIIYSNDRGRTWMEYEGNPVIKHVGRDPRLLWHKESKQWVMAVYNEDRSQKEKKQQERIDFYTSSDLKKWTFQSRIEDLFECPDIFELPVDGDAKNTKWVLTGASSDYFVGTFDGKTFKPETGKIKGHRGRGFYAAQTFINDPKGRVVQIGWMRAASPGMAFNQCMSLPLKLSLKTTKEGARMAWEPVEELQGMRDIRSSHILRKTTLEDGASEQLDEFEAQLPEMILDFTPRAGAKVEINVRGVSIVYDAMKQELSVAGQKASAPLHPDGRQKLHIFVDRTVTEVFASEGLCYIPVATIPASDNLGVQVKAVAASVEVHLLDLHNLKSIWK